MKKTKKSTSGTSFHDVTFEASINQLIGIFGEPSIYDNRGEYKCNFEWNLQTLVEMYLLFMTGRNIEN